MVNIRYIPKANSKETNVIMLKREDKTFEVIAELNMD